MSSRRYLLCSSAVLALLFWSMPALSADPDMPQELFSFRESEDHSKAWFTQAFVTSRKKGGTEGGEPDLAEVKGKRLLRIPKGGQLKTGRAFGGELQPNYAVDMLLSWKTGAGVVVGLGGKWFALKREGVRGKKGWRPRGKHTLASDQRHDLCFAVGGGRVLVWLGDRLVGTCPTPEQHAAEIVLQGWRETLACHRLVVRPLSAPPTEVSGTGRPAQETAVDGLASYPAVRSAELTGVEQMLVSRSRSGHSSRHVTMRNEEEVMDRVVLVTGKAGSGTGFVADMFDKRVVVSNAHVFLLNPKVTLRTRDGTKLKYRNVFVARKADIVLFELAPGQGAEALPLEGNVTKAAPRRTGVVVFGNSLGDGTITRLNGEVVSLGPDRIEVSATFVGGNSGSPVIATNTGKVIGVATFALCHVPTWVSQGTRFAAVRRFALRLDTLQPKHFDRLDPGLYRAEADSVRDAQSRCELTSRIIVDLKASPRLRPDNYDDERVKSIAALWNRDIVERIGASKRPASSRDAASRQRQLRRFLAEPFSQEAQRDFSYDRLESMYEELEEVHELLLKHFDELSERVVTIVGNSSRRR